MREYTPDLWTLLKISTNGETFYKILGSWYGGFGGSDSWRLSSGCAELIINGEDIVWPQSSGSVYKLQTNNIGVSNYARSVLDKLVKDHEGTTKVTEVTLDDYIKEVGL